MPRPRAEDKTPAFTEAEVYQIAAYTVGHVLAEGLRPGEALIIDDELSRLCAKATARAIPVVLQEALSTNGED